MVSWLFFSSTGDWGRTTTSKPALSTFPLSTWSLIFPGKEGKTAKSFNDILASQAPKMGIKVSAPNTVALPNDRLETYLKAIREQAEETQIVSRRINVKYYVVTCLK